MTCSRPHVLFLARWFPDKHDPMFGLFVQRHASVAATFAKVTVLHLREMPNKKPSFTLNVSREFDCDTVIVYYGSKCCSVKFFNRIFNNVFFFISFLKGYKYVVSNMGKPELIHVNVLTRLGVFALMLKLFKGIPYVITEHWSRYLSITGTYHGILRKLFTKWVVNNAKAVSTVSYNLANAMQRHQLCNDNYMLLPNVVDYELYSIGEEKYKPAPINILHVSCFENRSKNIKGLLHVISKLYLQRTDFKITLVGDGVDFEETKLYSHSLSLPQSLVCFTGLLENEDIVHQYQQADFFVMFSNFENMPVVISEALACGLPIVATAVGGIPEFVDDNNGLLVTPGDEDALLGAINTMLDNYKNYNKQSIRDSSKQYFSREAVAKALKTLYGIDITMD